MMTRPSTLREAKADTSSRSRASSSSRLRRIRLALPYRICYFDNVVIPEGGNRQKSREVGRMGTLRRASVLSVGVVMALVTAGCGETTSNQAAASPKPVIIGLITKTDANPFFVKMRQGAEREAAAKGAVLMTGAGQGKRRGPRGVG